MPMPYSAYCSVFMGQCTAGRLLPLLVFLLSLSDSFHAGSVVFRVMVSNPQKALPGNRTYNIIQPMYFPQVGGEGADAAGLMLGILTN